MVHLKPLCGAAADAGSVALVDADLTYDMRHTFASWAIAGGVSLFHLSKIMGTSTTMIGEVYGHLLPDSEDYLRRLLDAYDTNDRAASL